MNTLRCSISLVPIETSTGIEVNLAGRMDPGNCSNSGCHYPAAAMTDVEAHITGTVWKIEVQVGDSVQEGDTVVILESMKMEIPVESEDDGTVKEIRCEEGQSVSEGDVLVVLE